MARQLDILLLLPAALGLLCLCLFLYLPGVAVLNDSYDAAGRQIELSRHPGDLSHGLKSVKEADRRQARDSIDKFELALQRLEYGGAALQRDLFSDPREVRVQIDRMRKIWKDVKAPILQTAEKGGARPGGGSPQPGTALLAETSSNLRTSIAALQERRFAALMKLCGVYFLILIGARRLVKRTLVTPLQMVHLSRDRLTADLERFKSRTESEYQHADNFLAGMTSGALVLTADLKILRANRIFLETFDVNEEGIAGRDLHLVPSLQCLRQRTMEAIGSGNTEREDLAIEASGSGERRLLRVTIVPSYDSEGGPRVLLMFDDRTETERIRANQSEFEHRYRELMNQSSDGIVVMNKDGLIAGFNRAAEQMFGYSQKEISGKPVETLTQKGLPLLDSPTKGRANILKFDARKKNGTAFPAQMAIRLDETGPQASITGIVRDLSERRRLEFLERDCLRVLEMVTNNKDLDAVLTQLVGMVERQHAGVLCSVSMLRNGRLQYIAATGLPEGFRQATDGMPMGPSACSCGTAAYLREMTIVADITTDPLWASHRHLGHAHDLRAAWSVPIFSGLGTVLGTFAMYGRAAGRPGDGELDLLEMASRLAAVAIEQRQLTDRLTYQAHHDALTTLPNRFLFEDRLQHAISGARRSGNMVGMLFVDLDRFKLINDTLGHAAGDTLLQQVTQRLQSVIRESDTLARTGGDEFAVIVDQLSDPLAASEVAHKLLQILKAPFHIAGRDLYVTASVGISLYPVDGQDAAGLLRTADSAMYGAKGNGRNNFQCFAPEMSDALREQMDVEHHLHRALERGELSLYFQPQFNVKTRKLAAWETLLRWRHPELGLVLPGQFIPAAEESGLIVPIGAWVLQESCRQSKEWQESGHEPIPVAVNVSSVQFDKKEFVSSVAQILHDHQMDPNLLELEVTESLLMKDPEGFGPRLRELRDLGVRVAIDDFGTGYSSLSYLQSMPFDSLKIDRSFVNQIKSGAGTPLLIDSIVTLTHNLGMSVTAEGVETEAQFSALRRVGCDNAQGYLLSEALPADSAGRFARQQESLELSVA